MKQPDYGTEAHENRAAQLVWGVLLLGLLFAGQAFAAVAVVDGELGADDSEVMVEPIEPLSAAELDELVGPVALYPDDLLSIVLAASTYPLQVVQASRFLEQRQQNPDLQPDEEWDDSVVALLNYPEALALLNDDLDWTWKLGEAVLAQQEDVLAAVGDFRERARVAGNLESDERQVVEVVDDGAIEIKPADPEVIYVPYYEPSRVTVYHDYPVYHYYPRAYPVYYYPYPSGYRFSAGYFWGVTSAFSIGWSSHRLHLHHHAFHGHPYYGRTYYDRYYYRRPHLSLTYNYYRDYSRYRHSARRHHAGNYWRPRTVYYGSSPRHAYRRWAYRDGYRHHRRSHQERRDRRDHRDRREHRDVRDRHYAHDNAARNRHRDADDRRRNRADRHRPDSGDRHRRDSGDGHRRDSGEQSDRRERRRSDSDGRHGDGQRQPLMADSGRLRDADTGRQRPVARAPQRGSVRTNQAPDSSRAASLTPVQRENLRVLTQGNIRTVTPQRSATGRRSVTPRRNTEPLDSRIAKNRGRAPQATQGSRAAPAKVRRSAPVRVQRTATNKVQRDAPNRAQRSASNNMRRTAPTALQRTAVNKVHRTAPRTAPQRAERQVVKRARTAPARVQAGRSMQAQAQQAYAKRSAPARAPRAQSRARTAPKAQSRGTSIRQSAGNRSGKRISFARN